MQHSKYEHEAYFNEVEDLIEDLGYDKATAMRLAHQFMQDRGATDTLTPEEFVNLKIPGCLHCETM